MHHVQVLADRFVSACWETELQTSCHSEFLGVFLFLIFLLKLLKPFFFSHAENPLVTFFFGLSLDLIKLLHPLFTTCISIPLLLRCQSGPSASQLSFFPPSFSAPRRTTSIWRSRMEKGLNRTAPLTFLAGARRRRCTRCFPL